MKFAQIVCGYGELSGQQTPKKSANHMEINRDYESNFEQGLEQERKHSLSDENF